MRRLGVLLIICAWALPVSVARAWTWPVDGPVLRPFAFGEDPYAGGQHRGIDVGAPTGATVVAPASGEVTFAGVELAHRIRKGQFRADRQTLRGAARWEAILAA